MAGEVNADLRRLNVKLSSPGDLLRLLEDLLRLAGDLLRRAGDLLRFPGDLLSLPGDLLSDRRGDTNTSVVICCDV